MSLIALSTSLSLSAIAQQPRIVDVSPSTGPASGLTRVIITLQNVDLGCVNGGCEVWVTFGSVRQRLLLPSHTSTVALFTPAHAVGVVDVTVETSRGLTLALPDGFTYEDWSTVFEKLLIPVFLHQTGALGSQWYTYAAVHNAGDEPIELGDDIFSIPPSPVCEKICGCGDTSIVEPHQTLVILQTCHGWSHPAGLLVYIPREDGGVRPPLNFNINVRDFSQADDNLGTQVPVVRERDLFDEPFNILFVPTDSRYRLSLRVFHPDRVPDTTVLVRTYPVHSNDVLGETSVTLIGDNELPPHPANQPLRPGFAQIDLKESFPQIVTAGAVRVEIVPLTPITSPPSPTPRIWAMVSVTNNETQRVTIISPD